MQGEREAGIREVIEWLREFDGRLEIDDTDDVAHVIEEHFFPEPKSPAEELREAADNIRLHEDCVCGECLRASRLRAIADQWDAERKATGEAATEVREVWDALVAMSGPPRLIDLLTKARERLEGAE